MTPLCSSDDLSECSDLIPDTEGLGAQTREQSPQPQMRRPVSWNESAAARRLEAAPQPAAAPLARSSSSVSVSRGPEGSKLELSIPLQMSSGGSDRDAFSMAIREATQAFERSLVEAAENFSHNLAALRSYEASDQSAEAAVAAGEGGLKRSLSEHYLPAVAVPDFAEAAFDAIRRAQRMREVMP